MSFKATRIGAEPLALEPQLSSELGGPATPTPPTNWPLGSLNSSHLEKSCSKGSTQRRRAHFGVIMSCDLLEAVILQNTFPESPDSGEVWTNCPHWPRFFRTRVFWFSSWEQNVGQKKYSYSPAMTSNIKQTTFWMVFLCADSFKENHLLRRAPMTSLRICQVKKKICQ